jgi:hypothetical protein
VARQWKPASGKEEDGCGAAGYEEVADQADNRRAMSHAEGRPAVNAAGDALENSEGGYATKAIKNEGVGDVQCADEECGAGDDLPERGTINGHFHLE